MDVETKLLAHVEQLYSCEASLVQSVPIKGVYSVRPPERGIVHVFALSSHPRAQRCFAWYVRRGETAADSEIVTVLEDDPIRSPADAVRLVSMAVRR
jgi:hypothetical protein